MYIPNEEMKVNAFRMVFIPRNRDYFSRIGSVTSPAGAFSGDDDVRRQNRKVEDIQFWSMYAEQKSKESEE